MLRRLAVVLLLVFARPAQIGAQTGFAPEGALDFLLPTGARALGMGQAVVAAAAGSDVMWWNPALIARGPREVALNVTQTFATQGGGSDADIAVTSSTPLGPNESVNVPVPLARLNVSLEGGRHRSR